ncbi:MAG: hypothetical protein WCK66_11340, partial [Betaproteobacteria bacterium]
QLANKRQAALLTALDLNFASPRTLIRSRILEQYRGYFWVSVTYKIIKCRLISLQETSGLI